MKRKKNRSRHRKKYQKKYIRKYSLYKSSSQYRQVQRHILNIKKQNQRGLLVHSLFFLILAHLKKAGTGKCFLYHGMDREVLMSTII